MPSMLVKAGTWPAKTTFALAQSRVCQATDGSAESALDRRTLGISTRVLPVTCQRAMHHVSPCFSKGPQKAAFQTVVSPRLRQATSRYVKHLLHCCIWDIESLSREEFAFFGIRLRSSFKRLNDILCTGALEPADERSASGKATGGA